ncbi:MAG: lysophospholipid acyltransferase family protein [bacterium]
MRFILKHILYCIGWIFFRTVFTVFWRLRITGSEHVPKQGPVIIASHHRSNADPPVVGSSIFREVHFVAKEELFKIPVLKRLILWVNGLPIKRGRQDLKAFKKAIQLLKDGKVLLMFPEGHRNPRDSFLRPKPGVGFLAGYTEVPVVPVFVVNTEKILFFKKICVYFGKPMYFKGEHDYRKIAQQVMEGIQELKDTIAVKQG